MKEHLQRGAGREAQADTKLGARICRMGSDCRRKSAKGRGKLGQENGGCPKAGYKEDFVRSSGEGWEEGILINR